MSDIFAALAAEFPRDAVHWRAQTVTKDGTKALALAYLDARDVMDRLDDICGPAGWRNSVVETPKGRLIATIEIKVDDEWIGKTDGAGDTAVEGEKGGISDSLKRAAVLWGIGRYLYRLPAVWAPCEGSEFNGKRQWKKWTASPWDCVRGFTGPANTAALPKPTDRINDKQRDWLAGHAEASVGVAELCRHFGKVTLKDFTVGELETARDWLKSPTEKAA